MFAYCPQLNCEDISRASTRTCLILELTIHFVLIERGGVTHSPSTSFVTLLICKWVIICCGFLQVWLNMWARRVGCCYADLWFGWQSREASRHAGSAHIELPLRFPPSCYPATTRGSQAMSRAWTAAKALVVSEEIARWVMALGEGCWWCSHCTASIRKHCSSQCSSC